MMPNVTRGDRVAGLTAYLVGPGKRNEHEDPHLVAGDEAVMMWHDDAQLNRDAAAELARHLEQPRKVHGVDVSRGHVWHCSLSLRAEEGALSDQQWGDIARDFVAGMEFDDQEGTRAPCRWAAVRHGVSENGNDHVHLVVNLVREDGTKANVHRDFARAQATVRALEVKHGLEQLESVAAQRSTRGYHPAEREAQARGRARGRWEYERREGLHDGPAWESLDGGRRQGLIAAQMREDQPRDALAVKVRAAGSTSDSEAEFVRRLRGHGLIARPRYAAGREDVVTGYKVAERPRHGERPIWYGGNRLARDLSLVRLRERWPDTVQGAGEAVDEWQAAARGRRVVRPVRELRESDPVMFQQRADELRGLVSKLREVPLDDRQTWAAVARETSGALSAWSQATETVPGDLAYAARDISRSAQTFRRIERPARVDTSPLAGAALVLAGARAGSDTRAGQAAMIRQMLRMTQALHAAADAQSQARQAHTLAAETRGRLARVRDQMPGPVMATAGVASAAQQHDVALDAEAAAVLERVSASNAHSAQQARSPLPDQAMRPNPRTTTTEKAPERGVSR